MRIISDITAGFTTLFKRTLLKCLFEFTSHRDLFIALALSSSLPVTLCLLLQLSYPFSVGALRSYASRLGQ